MTNLVIPTLGFLSFFLIFLGIALYAKKWAEGVPYDLRGNVFLESPLGLWIFLLAKANESESLENLRAKVEKKFLLAGKPGGEISGSQFLAILEICSFSTFLFLFLFFSLVTGYSIGSILFIIVLSIFTFWLGFVWLENLISERRVQISRQYPYFVDLAVMTMDAGSSFIETMELYAKDNPSQPLGKEFLLTLGEIRMGKTFAEALGTMIQRVPSEEVQTSIRAILQAEKMGTPLAKLLREQSDLIRFKRSQMAERVAEEMKIRLQGPAMLFMISVLILILGPAFIGMFGDTPF